MMTIHAVLFCVGFFSTTFSAKIFQKVTEESKSITKSYQALQEASKETADLLGISETEAKKQILEALESQDGLASNGSLLSPTTAFCPIKEENVFQTDDSSVCCLQRLIPIHQAGFPNEKFVRPSQSVDSPDCEEILDNCCPKCPECNKCDKFRTIDGTCNNLGQGSCLHALWGSRNQAFKRLAPNNYDGKT